MSTIDVTVQVVDGVDQISVSYEDSISSMIVSEISNEIDTIQVSNFDLVDSISIDYNNLVSSITVTEVIPQIQVIQIDSGNDNLVHSVNDLIGAVTLTYKETLSYVSQSGGYYTYNVEHNLGYDVPMVMVYNDTNDLVEVDVDIIDENNVSVISTSNLNNFKVVVQR